MGSVFLCLIIIYSHTCIKIRTCSYHTFITCAPSLVCVSPLSASVSVNTRTGEFQTGIALLSYYIQILLLLLLYPDTKVKPARLSSITQRVNKEKKSCQPDPGTRYHSDGASYDRTYIIIIISRDTRRWTIL